MLFSTLELNKISITSISIIPTYAYNILYNDVRAVGFAARFPTTNKYKIVVMLCLRQFYSRKMFWFKKKPARSRFASPQEIKTKPNTTKLNGRPSRTLKYWVILSVYIMFSSLCTLTMWRFRCCFHVNCLPHASHRNCGSTPHSSLRWLFKLALCLYIRWHRVHGNANSVNSASAKRANSASAETGGKNIR